MKRSKISRCLLPFILVLVVLFAFNSCSASTGGNKMEKPNDSGEYGDSVGSGPAEGIIPSDAKIIRTLNVSGQTKDFDSFCEKLQNKITELGGYIESSQIRGGENFNGSYKERYASYVIRIPDEKYTEFRSTTRGMMNVTSQSESSRDVTIEYYDIESRVNTLIAKRTALEEMLSQAKSLDDMLLIQNSLYDVIADIEAYQSTLNRYDSLVDYSTVNLSVSEVVEYSATGERSFGERIADAFIESWANFGEFCQGFAVLAVSLTPFLVFPVIGVIALLIALRIRKSRQ